MGLTQFRLSLRNLAYKRTQLSRGTLYLCLVIFVYMIGWGVVIPFLPLYLKERLGNFTLVGIVLGLMPFASIAVALIAGLFLDKVSKRNTIRNTFLLYVPLGWILLQLTTITQFVLFRIYHGVISTILWLTSEAYLRAHSKKHEAKAFALFDFARATAIALGAILGAFLLEHFGYSSFITISIFSIIGFGLTLLLPDHIDRKVALGISGSIKGEIVKFWNNKPLVKNQVYMFFISLPDPMMSMLLPLYLSALGADLFKIGIIHALVYAPIFFEPYFANFKNKRILVDTAIITATLSFIFLSLSTSILITFFFALLLGLSIAALTPTIYGESTKLMRGESIGEYSAVSYALRGLAQGLGPLLSGVIADIFGLSAVFLGVGIIFLLIVPSIMNHRFKV